MDPSTGWSDGRAATLSDGVGRERLITVLCAILGVAGVVLALVVTGRYGAGLSQDSVDYVFAARNLAAGNGYLTHEGHPFVLWGPLLPTLLAVPGRLGLDLWQAGRWLNALAFGLIVFSSGMWYRRVLRSTTLVVLGTLASFGYPLLFVSTYIWSEGLFALFVLWFILRLLAMVRRPTWANWAWLVVPAALACLQRYIGGATVAAGSLVLLLAPLRGRSLRQRLAWCALFAATALAPVAAWMMRNQRITGRLTGGRLPSDETLGVHLQRIYDTMANWFLPIVAPVAITVIGVALVAAVWMAWRSVRVRRGLRQKPVPGRAPPSAAGAGAAPGDSDRWGMAVAATVVWLYLAALLYSALELGISPIDDRFLAPIYVPVLGLLLGLIDRFLLWATVRPGRGVGWGRGVVIAVTAVTLIVPLGRTYAYVQNGLQNGVPGFSDRTWAKSPITKWLRNNRLEGLLFTNDGWPLAMVAGRNVDWVPRGVDGVGPFLDDLAARSEPCYVIWYNRAWRRPREVLDALVASGRVRLVKKSSDGVVYQVER